MKKLLVILIIILVNVIVLQAQNMLGSTYGEVRANYKSHNKEYSNWDEGKMMDNASFYVVYTNRQYDYKMVCYFSSMKASAIVIKYVIIDSTTQINMYRKLFDEKYIKINENSWIDNNVGCTWELVIDGNLIFLEAVSVNKD
jgi:hypothetical protein